MLTVTIRDERDGQLVGAVVANAKTFRTGSDGFYGSTKLTIGGERYQVSVQAVRIGSKPDAQAAGE